MDDQFPGLYRISTIVKQLRTIGISVAEGRYLFNDIDEDKTIGPDPDKIQQFYEKLRKDLRKLPGYKPQIFMRDTTTSLLIPLSAGVYDPNFRTMQKKLIYQLFAAEFNLAINAVASIIDYANPAPAVLVDDCTNEYFINATYHLSESTVDLIDGFPAGTDLTTHGIDRTVDDNLSPSFTLHKLYDWYRFIYKVKMISTRLGLRGKEFEYAFFRPQATGFDFKVLPVNGALNGITGPLTTTIYPNTIFYLVLYPLYNLARLKQLAAKLSMPEAFMGRLADSTRGVLVPSAPVKYWPGSTEAALLGGDPLLTSSSTYFTDINASFDNWRATISQKDWNGLLEELVGDNVNTDGYTSCATSSITTPIFHLQFGTEASPLPFAYLNFSYWGGGAELVPHLLEIILWCKRSGLRPRSLVRLLKGDVTLSDSRALILAVRSKYDDGQWASVAKPLRDKIRVRQRDALLAYTVTRPNVIYGNLLIDVEMDACMLTSRVKQAISSVQLLMDRILLKLEYTSATIPPSLITMDTDTAEQWLKWRKWYGIWHGNREIFLHPENWMEPELRDDRSVFFKELEAELKQNDITFITAESAIRTYLQKLDSVGNLDPVGSCIEQVTSAVSVTHVIGRTKGGSPKYYYRKLKYDMWTPWEPIDVQVAGEHVVPYFFKGRLFLFWLTFNEKVAHKTKKMIDIATGLYGAPYIQNYWFYNDNTEPVTDNTEERRKQNYKQLEVSVNWTEYKDGKWLNQKTGDEKMLIKVSPWLQKFMAERVFPYNTDEHNLFTDLMDRLEMSVHDFVQARTILHPNFLSTSPGTLYLELLFPTFLSDSDDDGHAEYADFFRTFAFTGESVAVTLPEADQIKRYLGPIYTYFKNNKLQGRTTDLILSDYMTTTYPYAFFNYDANLWTTPYFYPQASYWFHPSCEHAGDLRDHPSCRF